jgi:hypothetical protein
VIVDTKVLLHYSFPVHNKVLPNYW